MEQVTKDAKFIRHLSILTLIVIAASIALRSYITVWWPGIVGLFLVVSLVMYFLCERAKKKGMRKFSNFYMASTMVKIVLYLAIIFVYAINYKEDSKRFAITFLAYYLIFNVFETFKLAKKDKNSADGNK